MTMSLKVIEFKTEYRRNSSTGKVDRPVDMVLLTNLSKHGRSETWHRVKDLMPREDFDPAGSSQRETDIQKFFAVRWGIIGPQYENFKKGTRLDIEGTLLGTWPLLNADEVRTFRTAGIHTVEEVAALSESAIGRIPLPDLRGKKKAAQKLLANSDTVAMQARIEALEKLLAAHGEPAVPTSDAVLQQDLEAAIAQNPEAYTRDQQEEAAAASNAEAPAREQEKTAQVPKTEPAPKSTSVGAKRNLRRRATKVA